ncbi:hypothetical protein D3C74_451210 [compost metagenome]
MCRYGNDRACFSHFFHDLIHFLPAVYIVGQQKFRRTGRRTGKLGIMSKIPAFPDGQLQACLQLKKSNGTMLKLCANDPLCRQPQAALIKFQRTLQIIHS